MKKRYIFFVVLTIPNIISLVRGRYITLIFLLPLVYTLYLINKIEKDLSENVGLSKEEKIQVIVTEVLNPLIAGAFYYYTWKDKFPKKANQANLYSWIVVGVEIVLYVLFKVLKLV